MDNARCSSLAGRKILVIEDEFFLADDLKRTLVDHGAEVMGPANTMSRARSIMSEARPDFAVLDVNLRGEMTFPLADELHQLGVPFVFTTGYDSTMIPAAYQHVERLEKPFVARQLVEAITDMSPINGLSR